MLNKLDDYPVHQTPEPLGQHSSSDRNIYDRTWFNGYAKDSSYYFGLGMAIYPHRHVLDAASHLHLALGWLNKPTSEGLSNSEENIVLFLYCL